MDTDPVYEDRVSSQNSYAYITPTGIQFANPEMTEPAPDPIRDPEGYKHRKDWRCLGAFYEKKWNTKLLPESYRSLGKLIGLVQLNINFLRPYGKITNHKDDGYSIVSTLHTGMKDAKEETVGMCVDGVNKFPLQNELVCFDGINGVHSMWNNTPEWRITAVFDIRKEAFI